MIVLDFCAVFQVQLYFMILERLGKYVEALEVVQGPLGGEMKNWMCFFSDECCVLNVDVDTVVFQRNWPVNFTAARTKAWCCTAAWSAGPSATRSPANCFWRGESTADVFSSAVVEIDSRTDWFFGVFVFQPWWLAVLLDVFWFSVPPDGWELDAATRRASVSTNMKRSFGKSGPTLPNTAVTRVILFSVQIRRGWSSLHRGPSHHLHRWASEHGGGEGVEASERTVPGSSGAHQTTESAELHWSTAARYSWRSVNHTTSVCSMCVSHLLTRHDAGEPLELMFQFFVKFGEKPCCITDLKIFLDLLSPEQHVQVRTERA